MTIWLAKLACTKLAHEFIFGCDKNKKNKNNFKKFEGFSFQMGNTEFEKKVEIKEKY